MNGYITLGFCLLIGGVLLYCYFHIQIKLGKARTAEQARNKQLTLQLNPHYLQKTEADRAYELKRREQERQFYLEQQRLNLEQQKLTVELTLQQARFQLDQHLALTRITPEIYLLDYEPRTITALPPLKRIAEEKEKPYAHLLESPYQPPTEDYLLSHIQENSCTVSPGIRASNGEVVLVDITQVPHGKLIGSSGFGKSTAMYIMLKQAAETNHPKRLQLALLDLEHKTSKLLEDYPHVATLQIGKRLVQMVATSADQVAEYLGYLKRELDRRTQLSELELIREPALIIYVEEMLSLQYEVLDPKLLQTIFYSLTTLSVRGKKYGMYLYACMQTDYSTDELKISQKMFRFRAAASVDPSAARAAGFINTELVKHNFQTGKPGQLVVEFPSFSDLVLVPALELKHELAKKSGLQDSFNYVVDTGEQENLSTQQSNCNDPETDPKNPAIALQARLLEVAELRANKWGKVKIIEKIWKVKAGSSKAYKQAEAEYEQIITQLESERVKA